MVLYTQAWDIIYGSENEYNRFIPEYLKEVGEAGLVPVGGYYVEVGAGPRIIAVHSANDFVELSSIISARKFRGLIADICNIVHNYRSAVLEPTGRVKYGQYTIQKGVWKLNQYYDLRPGRKKEYADFVINEHIPTLEKLSYVEVTGGWNVILGGISEIMAEFTFKNPEDIGRLLNSEDFRKITLKLKTEFVTNYSSRILRCTERFDEPRWFKL